MPNNAREIYNEFYNNCIFQFSQETISGVTKQKVRYEEHFNASIKTARILTCLF